MLTQRLSSCLVFAACLAFAACGDDSSLPDAGLDAATDAATDTGSDAVVPLDADSDAADSSVDAGPLPDYPEETAPASRAIGDVRIESVAFDVPAPPPNPTSGEATPIELNRIGVERYRRDVEPAAEARSVVIAMPGLLAGAASLDGLARGLVSESEEAIEVWVIDRRSNALEDLRGMDTAEVSENAEIAAQYYRGEATIDDEAFAGLISQSELSYMSEWGLATLVGDVHALIGSVEEDQRKARVFLLGHSLGASFAEAYAAWRFEDGTRGVEELAGIVLVDGALSDEPITEEEYSEGFSVGGFPSEGIDEIREDSPTLSIPFLGVNIYIRAEEMALRARFDPEGVVEDSLRDDSLSLLLAYPRDAVPMFTNSAAFALPFDDASGALAFARLGVGEPVGDTENFTSLLGDELTRPVLADAAVVWQDGPESGEASSMEEFTRSFTAGPTNYAEWYFPARLPLDIVASGGARIAEDGWEAAQGLRSFDGALIDAPILAVACALIGSTERYDAIRARVAPVIGEGRPLSGASREDAGAFVVLDALTLLHLDPGVSAVGSRNPTIGATLYFLAQNSAAGSVDLAF